MRRVLHSVRKSSKRPKARRAGPRSRRPKLRTVVIEDETMFRQLILATLGTIRNVEVVGEFGLGAPGLDYCLRKRVDLLVVDLLLPDIEGLEIARRVRAAAPNVKILVITAHPNERLPADLMALGVAGYVDKNGPVEYVVNAVETLSRGGMFFASHVQAQSAYSRGAHAHPAAAKVSLTEREREIVRMVADGKMSKEIAKILNLSHRTVENHRAKIMQKVGVHEVASLTRWCIEAGLLPP